MSDFAIVAKPIANPGPLGLFCFGITTCALSAVNIGWLPATAAAAIVPMAFASGGLGQLVAGIMEFKLGNTFGATAFTSYAMFWWWYALLNWSVGAKILGAPPASAAAMLLLLWGVFTLLMWLVTFRLNKALCVLFLLLTVTFFVLAAADFGMGAPFAHVGGWIGLITGIAAFATAFIELLNTVAGRVILSLGAPILHDEQ